MSESMIGEGYIPSEVIMDLYENPLNYGILKKYDIKLISNNLGCGDLITIYIKLEKNIIKNIKHTFSGSVISKAGASIATELVLNKSIDDVIKFDSNVILEQLGGVIKTRQKCALFTIDVIKNGLNRFIENLYKTPFVLKKDI